MATKTKKIPQLNTATTVTGSDLILLNQSNVTKKATFALLKQAITEDFAHARDVQLRKSDGYIQWRYVGDTVWTNLVSLEELQGPPGSGAAVETFFVADGVKKIFNPISSILSADPVKYNVSVGGLVQQAYTSYTVSLADGGSLIFDEAPPAGLPISIIAFQ